MYALHRRASRSVRKLYTETARATAATSRVEEAEQALDRLPRPARPRLRARPHDAARRRRRRSRRRSTAASRAAERPSRPAVARDDARAGRRRALDAGPPGFTVHPKLERHPRRPPQASSTSGEVDWALAEALAFGIACCSRARRCASPARTRGAARSASATRCSSTSAPRTSTSRSPTSAPDQAPFMLYDSRALRVRRARLRVRLLGRRPGGARAAGRRSSATS